MGYLLENHKHIFLYNKSIHKYAVIYDKHWVKWGHVCINLQEDSNVGKVFLQIFIDLLIYLMNY